MKMGKSVGALLIKEHRILLQHRDNDAPKYPNYWAFFGGAVEQHESPEQALKRELMEELSITTNKFTFYKKKIVKKEGFFFIVNFTEPVEKLKSQQTEGDYLGLFSFNETKQLMLTPFCIPLLNNLYKEGYLE